MQWAEEVESKKEALAVSLSITKAFDRVWHKAILSKLPLYGLSEKLCNRITIFQLNQSSSRLCLSFTLFILHMNNMLQSSNINCYAADSRCDSLYSNRSKISRNKSMNAKIILCQKSKYICPQLRSGDGQLLFTLTSTSHKLCFYR